MGGSAIVLGSTVHDYEEVAVSGLPALIDVGSAVPDPDPNYDHDYHETVLNGHPDIDPPHAPVLGELAVRLPPRVRHVCLNCLS